MQPWGALGYMTGEPEITTLVEGGDSPITFQEDPLKNLQKPRK